MKKPPLLESERPTIDTARAIGALEDAGLDPDIADALVRLVDEAVRNAAASSAEMAELKLHAHKFEQRVLAGLVALFALIVAMLTITANLDTVVRLFAGPVGL